MDLITFTHMTAMSLHRVGLAGAAVEMKTFHRLGKEWQQEAAMLKDKIVKFALRKGMEQFSPTNDNQVRELLFDKMKLPSYGKTKTGERAVDKFNLQRIQNEHKKIPFIDNLIAFNQSDKLASTWYGVEGRNSKSVQSLIQPLLGGSAGTGKDDLGLLHNWIFPLRTRTGRRSSGGGEEGDPAARNSQNWPPAARSIIRSRWAKSKIAVCDFSRLEVVLVGWVAGDEKLLDYFLNGRGYLDVAREFWGTEVEDGSKQYKVTKALVLGLNYGMGHYHLAMDLKHKAGFEFSTDWEEHVKQTYKARDRYLNLFSALRSYHKARYHEVSRTQQVVSATGRVRHMPHHGQDSEGYWRIKNQALNFPIQSLASDITGGAIVDYEEALLNEHKLSYADWHRALLERPFDPPASPVFNEVHDELDIDLHPKTGKRDLELLVESMRNCRTLKGLVPDFKLKLKVDVQAVKTWGEAK